MQLSSCRHSVWCQPQSSSRYTAKRSLGIAVKCQSNATTTDTIVTRLAKGLAACAAAATLTMTPAADAVLNSPNARIARTSEAALRRSIPAFNNDVHQIQSSLEEIQFKLRIPQRKPWASMSDDLTECQLLASATSSMLQGVFPADTENATKILDALKVDLERLNQAVTYKDPDKSSIRLAKALSDVAQLELLQAPGLAYRIPQQYASLPRLTGRAIVHLEIENSNGRAVFVDTNSEDGPQKRVKLELTVDGYSAPLTAGNFIYNVLEGNYNGNKIDASPSSVLMGEQGKNIGALPLEMLPVGEFSPIYRSPLDVLDGELPVLPLSIYGAAAMTHLPGADSDVGFVSSRQFFLYLYERGSSGLSGLSFDEGQFPVFGYVTKGIESLSKIGQGDVLVSATVLSGKDKLVVPNSEAVVASTESTAS